MRKLTAPLKNTSLTKRGGANEKAYAIAAFCISLNFNTVTNFVRLKLTVRFDIG